MAKKRSNNQGSISKRPSGTWRAQVSINGERVNFSAKTRAECQIWLNRTLEQIDNGADLLGSQITLEEYLKSWLETAKVAIRPKTAVQYEHIVRAKLIPNLGNIKLRELRLDRVEKFYAQLKSAGFGTRTIRLSHGVLHRAMERAVRLDLIMRNPAHGATLPSLVQQEMKIFDEEQITRFLVAVNGTRNEALYHLAVTTGMRQGELFGLKWSDLKWSSGTLHVQRQVQHIHGQGWSFCEPKTRAGRRLIKLGEATLQVLRKHQEKQQIEKLVTGERWKEYELIFPSSIGTPMDPNNLHVDFNRLLDHAGLPRIRFHDLRHTAASLMLNHSIPVIVVSKILGHSKPSITLDIYGHLFNEMQDEASRIIDELVTPIQIQISQIKVSPSN